MTEKQTDKQVFAGFFREEAAQLLGLTNESKPAETLGGPVSAIRILPVLPLVKAAEEKERRTYWRMLRTFFRTGKDNAFVGEPTAAAIFPLPLDLYHNAGFLPAEYPLWIAGAVTAKGETQPEESLLAVAGLLTLCTGRFAPGEGQAKILKDNLPRLEVIIRKKLDFADTAYQASPVFAEALEDLVAQLDIKGREGDAFREDVASLKRELPRSGFLIPCSRLAPFHLLAAWLHTHRLRQLQALKEDIAHLSARLHDLLLIEREKSPEARSPEQLHSTLDFADAFLQFDELSSLLPKGGAAAMPEERLHRIEKILETLGEAENQLINKKAVVVLSAEIRKEVEADWTEIFPGADLIQAAPGEACTRVAGVFDERMDHAAQIFAAIRLGKLETQDAYRPEIHGDFFAHFDWRSFSEGETELCPPVILLADTTALVERELNVFSGLLVSNRPVKLIAVRQEESTARPAGQPDQTLVFRQEPGALAVAHRNAYVMQGSAVDPWGLFTGFAEGFASSAPALFHVFLPSLSGARSDLYLRASAAAEGRAFPGFTYNSAKGPGWGSRFDIASNPQPTGDWPLHRVAVSAEDGRETALELAFTFADYAALDPSFAGHFHLVPPEYWDDHLVPLADYLSLPADDNFSIVPFIWVVDENRRLHKAAVAWPLTLMCRERLDFWRYLQENAGIHSYHVEKATEALRREIGEKYEQQEAALREAHLKELENAREEAARSAMERLASALLELDAGPLVATVTTSAVHAPEKAPVPVPDQIPRQEIPQSPAPVEEQISLALGEAWIDTPLCTSCNECTDTNKKIFKYNAEKQAYVDNPRGGPFADIVKAAEKCPAKIIHPGAPQDPNEPNLENLIKRAKPFN